jgi:hypothetical protein
VGWERWMTAVAARGSACGSEAESLLRCLTFVPNAAQENGKSPGNLRGTRMRSATGWHCKVAAATATARPLSQALTESVSMYGASIRDAMAGRQQ